MKKPRRVVLGSGTLQASLMTAWVECGSGVPNICIPIGEKGLQKEYRKKVRLVLEVLEP